MKTLLLVLLLAGCATKAQTDLDRMQRDIQDCVLRGGHPRLAPADTIVCQED